MKVSMICFTAKGFEIEKKIAKALEDEGCHTIPFVLGKYAFCAAASEKELAFCAVKEGGLSEWAGEQFQKADALVFVGACGIAVRAIAPFVKDKRTDPAVVVADEGGNYVIPILSGHLGGANELAGIIGRRTGAQPVFTTATDVRNRFAVDVFAKERGLWIDNMKTAKAISADILAGEPVGVICDFPIEGKLPDGLFKDAVCRHNIWITFTKKTEIRIGDERRLKLIPRCVTVGIGCRRGTEKEKLKEILIEAMEEHRLDERSVCAFSSIDLKKGEPGICELAKELEIPFLTYTKEELELVPGTFTESDFVRKTTGVGNVCERAAMAACLTCAKEGKLLFPKYAKDGVTVSAAYFCPKLFGCDGREQL